MRHRVVGIDAIEPIEALPGLGLPTGHGAHLRQLAPQVGPFWEPARGVVELAQGLQTLRDSAAGEQRSGMCEQGVGRRARRRCGCGDAVEDHDQRDRQQSSGEAGQETSEPVTTESRT